MPFKVHSNISLGVNNEINYNRSENSPNFGESTGPTGPTGPEGPQGIQGFTGATGPSGSDAVWVTWTPSATEITSVNHSFYSESGEMVFISFNFDTTFSSNSDVLTLNTDAPSSGTYNGIMSSVIFAKNGTNIYQPCRIEISPGSSTFSIRGNFFTGKNYNFSGQIFYLEN